MKTVIFEQGETLGGAERYIVDFLKSTTKSERETQLGVSLLGVSGDAYQAALPNGIPVVPFALPSFKGGLFKKIKGGVSMILLGRKLKKILKKGGTKTMLTNTPRASLMTWMSKAIWGGDYRWVAVVHDFHTQAKLYAPIHKFMRRRMLQKADKIIAVSLITRQKVKEYLPEKDQQKIQIIENGIDLRKTPSPKKINGLKKIIMVARIDPRKGQMKFLEAINYLKLNNEDVFKSLSFGVIGGSFAKDPDTVSYEKEIKSYDQKHELGVDFLGEVDDPFAEIKSADAVLMLPQEGETFGRVAIEAMSVGTVVLSLKEDGPEQIMRAYSQFINMPGETFLIEENTGKSIAEKIISLKQIEKDLNILTESGREFVEKNYNLKESHKRMLNLLLG